MFYKGMREPTENAMHTAMEFAWRELEHHPWDGGDCDVHFEGREDHATRWDGYNNVEIPDTRHKIYVGTLTTREEEGGRRVDVRVEPIIEQHTDEVWEGVGTPYAHCYNKVIGATVTDDWLVTVSFHSRDCDGDYRGGHEVIFRDGQLPEVINEQTRDLRAEAAGY